MPRSSSTKSDATRTKAAGKSDAKPKPTRSGNPGKLAPAPAAGELDAIELLTADHREVKALFDLFEANSSDAEKRDIAIAICVALKVHARLEEELFYPAAFAAVDDPSLIEEAQVEHASAKDLIAQIETGAPGEAFFEARVKVLGEYIDHHVGEEESEIFPQCRAAKLDLKQLGAIMALRKQELMAGFTISNPILALS